MEEQVLAERCRQGDNLARKELYEQYAGRMLGVCLRYAGDRETAQDLMHDGFLKLFDSFDKFTWRGEGSLRAWMERVMVNTVLQYLRKNDVMSQSAALDDVPETYEEPDASAVDTIPQKVLMQFISFPPVIVPYSTCLFLKINLIRRLPGCWVSTKSHRLHNWYVPKLLWLPR